MTKQESSGSAPAIITRQAVAEQIGLRLTGRLSDATLAEWAFSSFYDVEAERTDLEAGFEEVIADALDALMFGDDDDFRLSEEELQALAQRLAQRLAQLG